MSRPESTPARSEPQRADAIEAAAFADLFDAAPAALKSALGLRVERVGPATALIAAGLPTTMFNRVIGVDGGRASLEADLDALQAHYRAAGVRTWWLHVTPSPAAGALLERLQARGFAVPARRSWAKMMRPAAAVEVPPSALTVAPTSDLDIGATCDAIARSFGMPPPLAGWLAALHRRPRWRVYAIADGAEVAGGAALFIDGDTGWLGMGSVLPGHRRRGGQLASMAVRIADAAASGCTAVVTETGEPIGDEPNPSLSNMRRAGFAQVASRLNLEWQQPPA